MTAEPATFFQSTADLCHYSGNQPCNGQQAVNSLGSFLLQFKRTNTK